MTRWMIAATALAYVATTALPQMAAAQAPAASAQPWMNKSLPAEKRAELLLAAMNQDEKIAL